MEKILLPKEIISQKLDRNLLNELNKAVKNKVSELYLEGKDEFISRNSIRQIKLK